MVTRVFNCDGQNAEIRFLDEPYNGKPFTEWYVPTGLIATVEIKTGHTEESMRDRIATLEGWGWSDKP